MLILKMTTVPTNTLSQRGKASHEYINAWPTETEINVCYFNPLGFRAICYVVMDNKHIELNNTKP
jgi:hypothetical protein